MAGTSVYVWSSLEWLHAGDTSYLAQQSPHHLFYNWTKNSRLEINIFGFKDDGEKWPSIHFEIHRAGSEIPANKP